MILVGESFWGHINEVIRKELLEKHHTIDKEDMNLYIITDDVEKIVDIVRHAPIREQD